MCTPAGRDHSAARCLPCTQIRVLEVLGRQAILGTTSGSVHVVDVVTGKATAAASSLDHLDSVMGCGSSERLRHFVTCGKDSQIKVRCCSLAPVPAALRGCTTRRLTRLVRCTSWCAW